MNGEREPRVKLMTLREYATSDGRPYFRGWLGDAVVLIFRNEEVAPEYGATATWDAFVVPKKLRQSEASAPAKPARRNSTRPAQQHLKLVAGQGSRSHPGLEDEIGF